MTVSTNIDLLHQFSWYQLLHCCFSDNDNIPDETEGSGDHDQDGVSCTPSILQTTVCLMLWVGQALTKAVFRFRFLITSTLTLTTTACWTLLRPQWFALMAIRDISQPTATKINWRMVRKGLLIPVMSSLWCSWHGSGVDVSDEQIPMAFQTTWILTGDVLLDRKLFVWNEVSESYEKSVTGMESWMATNTTLASLWETPASQTQTVTVKNWPFATHCLGYCLCTVYRRVFVTIPPQQACQIGLILIQVQD